MFGDRQLRALRAESVESPVVSAGFTLVEEDDVAFTLSLCREVHRIYGGYQDGSLAATDSLKGGLLITIEMLAALTNTIDGGMPSMRIAVAATQTREILAVMFDEDPIYRPVAAALWGPPAPANEEAPCNGVAAALEAPPAPAAPVRRRGVLRI